MGKIAAMTGNTAAYTGAALCRPDLIAAYPITPQSSVVEGLAGMVYNGKLDSSFVQVESEHSAMSVVQGAAAAGGRVFTATSAQGLALMYEPYFRMSTLRIPMVMALATREMTSPETIWSGQQDAMSVREAGWIQMFCESNQEILDMMLQAYRIAEDPRVQLPVNVCYDGFYSSHLIEGLDVPSQAEADAFLPAYDGKTYLDPGQPAALDPLTPGDLMMKYRKNHLDAMKAAQEVIEEVDAKFAAQFGRSYGGLIEEYKRRASRPVSSSSASSVPSRRKSSPPPSGAKRPSPSSTAACPSAGAAAPCTWRRARRSWTRIPTLTSPPSADSAARISPTAICSPSLRSSRRSKTSPARMTRSGS